MSVYVNGLHLRSDGRQEVDDTSDADDRYGCPDDSWCILRAGHDGLCCDDREADPTTYEQQP